MMAAEMVRSGLASLAEGDPASEADGGWSLLLWSWRFTVWGRVYKQIIFLRWNKSNMGA